VLLLVIEQFGCGYPYGHVIATQPADANVTSIRASILGCDRLRQIFLQALHPFDNANEVLTLCNNLETEDGLAFIGEPFSLTDVCIR
jgi:hypothetical protein